MSVSAASNAFALSFASEPGDNADVNLALIFDRYKDRFTAFPKEKVG